MKSLLTLKAELLFVIYVPTFGTNKRHKCFLKHTFGGGQMSKHCARAALSPGRDLQNLTPLKASPLAMQLRNRISNIKFVPTKSPGR